MSIGMDSLSLNNTQPIGILIVKVKVTLFV